MVAFAASVVAGLRAQADAIEGPPGRAEGMRAAADLVEAEAGRLDKRDKACTLGV